MNRAATRITACVILVAMCLGRISAAQPAAVKPPVEVARVWPEKLLYPVGQTARVAVTLRNHTAAMQTVRLTLRLESGLADTRLVYDRVVEVPARVGSAPNDGSTHLVEIDVPSLPEYGNTVVAEVSRDGTAIHRASEHFYASNQPVEIGHYGSPGGFLQVNYEKPYAELVRSMDGLRASYFPLAEVMFWAPNDVSMLTPPAGTDRWWSSQSAGVGYSTQVIKDVVRAGHSQGIRMYAYVDYNWAFNWRIWELWRAHPEWAEWYGLSPGFAMRDLPRWQREDQKELQESRMKNDLWMQFESRPILSNPGMVQYHADQLVASMKLFGWDGFRYDCWKPWDRVQWDLLGREGPFVGWTHAAILKYFRQRVQEVKPDAVIGANEAWPEAGNDLERAKQKWMSGYAGQGWPNAGERDWVKSFDRTEDPQHYVAILRDGGMALGEHVLTVHADKTPWQDWAKGCLVGGRKARQYGGHQYVICNWPDNAIEQKYMLSMLLAGGCHVAYGVKPAQIPYMRLACRYSDLLYGKARHFPSEPEKLLDVRSAGRPLWWRDYVAYRTVAPGRRVYFVHLFNPPHNPNMGGAQPAQPDAARDVRLSWTLPAGWSARRAYHLTADLGDQLSYPLTLDRSSVSVPEVRLWSIVALECDGPADAIEPKDRAPLPPVTVPALERIETRRVRPWVVDTPDRKVTRPWVLPTADQVAAAAMEAAVVPGEKGPRVWYGNGMFHEYQKLEMALKSLGAVVHRGEHRLDGHGQRSRWDGLPFPATPARLMSYQLVVLDNIPYLGNSHDHYIECMARSIFEPAGFEWQEKGRADQILALGRKVCFDPDHAEWLLGYVKAGGRLLITAGPFSFGPGGWHVSPLSKALPVEVDSFLDLQPVGATLLPWKDLETGKQFSGQNSPVPLSPASPLAQGLDWSAKPVLMWQHVLKAKPDAVVHVSANGNPVVVVGTYGKGKVAVITAAPLGEARAGQTAFWDWPQWPKLMETVLNDLLKQE